MKKCPLCSLANKLSDSTMMMSDRCQPSCGLYEDSSNMCSLVVLAKIGIEELKSRRTDNARDITNTQGE